MYDIWGLKLNPKKTLSMTPRIDANKFRNRGGIICKRLSSNSKKIQNSWNRFK